MRRKDLILILIIVSALIASVVVTYQKTVMQADFEAVEIEEGSGE